MQHSQKFMEQMNSTEVRETRMVKGDSHTPWRSTQRKPHFTNSAVRLTVPQQAFHPLQKASQLLFEDQNAPDLGNTEFTANAICSSRYWIEDNSEGLRGHPNPAM